MIKLTDGGFAEMWNGASVDAKCLSYALQRASEGVLASAGKSMCNAMIDSLDEKTLDHMAVELRAMYYDQSLPIEAKREIIRASFSGWYMKAGTPAAVNELVQAVFGEGRVIEWFDFDEDSSPYLFDIKTNAPLTEDILEYFAKIINRVKNERSKLRRVLVERNIHTKPRVGIYAVTYSKLTITNGGEDKHIKQPEVHQRWGSGAISPYHSIAIDGATID